MITSAQMQAIQISVHPGQFYILYGFAVGCTTMYVCQNMIHSDHPGPRDRLNSYVDVCT